MPRAIFQFQDALVIPILLFFPNIALHYQLCDFGMAGLSSGASPDRLDALVWAVTELSARTARGEPRVGSEASLRPDLRAPRTHTQNRDLRYWFAFGDKAMTVALQAAS
jgi:hypothetical protein